MQVIRLELVPCSADADGVVASCWEQRVLRFGLALFVRGEGETGALNGGILSWSFTSGYDEKLVLLLGGTGKFIIREGKNPKSQDESTRKAGEEGV
jgi:hypothetical protein